MIIIIPTSHSPCIQYLHCIIPSSLAAQHCSNESPLITTNESPLVLPTHAPVIFVLKGVMYTCYDAARSLIEIIMLHIGPIIIKITITAQHCMVQASYIRTYLPT